MSSHLLDLDGDNKDRDYSRGNSGCCKAAKISVDICIWMPDSHHFLCWGHLSRRPTSSMATANTKTARLLSSAHATCTYPAKTMSWCAGPVYSSHIGRVSPVGLLELA